MKKEIIVAAAFSAAFHLGLIFGGGSGEDAAATTDVILTDEKAEKEAPPPPPPPPQTSAQGEDQQDVQESILPDDLLAPGLNEPPASSVSMDALTQFVKPEAPHPPRPDVAVGIPTGARHAGAAGIKSSVVFSLDQLDHVPEVRYQPKPRYPYELQSAGIEGEVVLILYVDERGTVADIDVKSVTNPGFVNNAVDAVRKWRFEPGLRKGKPVPFKMQQAIPFTIQGRRR